MVVCDPEVTFTVRSDAGKNTYPQGAESLREIRWNSKILRACFLAMRGKLDRKDAGIHTEGTTRS